MTYCLALYKDFGFIGRKKRVIHCLIGEIIRLDLDINALLGTLVAKKDEKLLGLKTIEGFHPVIPRAKEGPDGPYGKWDHPLL